jgi:hypothetical protein
MTQIKKTYQEISPELLNAEIKEFILKQGARLGENKLETYTLPDESAVFGTRSTMTFTISGKECLRVHVVGSIKSETKLMIDVDDKLFPAEKLSALQADLDFIFGSYEVKE